MPANSEAIFRHRDYYLNLGLTLKPMTPVEDQSDAPVVAIMESAEKLQIKGALESDKTSFVATVPEDVSAGMFLRKLGSVSDLREEEILGSDYVEQMASAVLYPSVMAAYPATFDTTAIAGIIDMVGSSNQTVLFHPDSDLLMADEVVDRTVYLTNKMLELGAIEYLYDDRFIITPKKKEKLTNILNRFDEEE